MNRIVRCGWLPKGARWRYLARSGLPAVFRKKMMFFFHVIQTTNSPSFAYSVVRDGKENREKKMAARNPGGEERAKGKINWR